MRRALKANGSPEPTFYTDAARLSFWTEIKVHPEFLNERVPAITQEATDEAEVEASDQDTVEDIVEDTVNDTELRILKLCFHRPASRKDILIEFNHKIFSGNIRLSIKRLRERGLILPTVEDKPSSKNQRYKITEKGKKVLRFNE